jgi:hypothetical protein
MKRIENMGLAAALTGLVLLSAAFVVGLAAPHAGGEIAAPFLLAER